MTVPSVVPVPASLPARWTTLSCAAVLLAAAAGCRNISAGDAATRGSTAAGTASLDEPPRTFDEVVERVRRHADGLVLFGDGDSRLLISPRLQGRIMTASVGSTMSSGFVNHAAIAAGEVHPQFNNFGGMDRFWIGPEAGPYGIYFPPGAELNRDTWQVPEALDKGGFEVIWQRADKITMVRDMEVTNYGGVRFKVHVQRELGIIPSSALSAELGVQLPEGVPYLGCYSRNTMTNAGRSAWKPRDGLIGIWILGMFNASPRAVVIAPFRRGDKSELGPIYNDDYFGRLPADRLQVLGGAVLFRADGSRVGKFGLSQKRTAGIAGSYDFTSNLLTIVKFDVPPSAERYGNSTWVAKQKDPYGGDVFQSYNHGDAQRPGKRAAEAFYELESASPVRPLAPGESIEHRHATFHFQGTPEELGSLARSVLGVDLAAVRTGFLK